MAVDPNAGPRSALAPLPAPPAPCYLACRDPRTRRAGARSRGPPVALEGDPAGAALPVRGLRGDDRARDLERAPPRADAAGPGPRQRPVRAVGGDRELRPLALPLPAGGRRAPLGRAAPLRPVHGDRRPRVARPRAHPRDDRARGAGPGRRGPGARHARSALGLRAARLALARLREGLGAGLPDEGSLLLGPHRDDLPPAALRLGSSAAALARALGPRARRGVRLPRPPALHDRRRRRVRRHLHPLRAARGVAGEAGLAYFVTRCTTPVVSAGR